jgi:uncharacterized protein YlzI (FlbEa/FlbD family)
MKSSNTVNIGRMNGNKYYFNSNGIEYLRTIKKLKS